LGDFFGDFLGDLEGSGTDSKETFARTATPASGMDSTEAFASAAGAATDTRSEEIFAKAAGATTDACSEETFALKITSSPWSSSMDFLKMHAVGAAGCSFSMDLLSASAVWAAGCRASSRKHLLAPTAPAADGTAGTSRGLALANRRRLKGLGD
jgi:hypothetical protein